MHAAKSYYLYGTFHLFLLSDDPLPPPPPKDGGLLNWAGGGSFKQAHEICYLPSAVFIALMLVGPGKCLKQIIQIKPKKVKNPNWRKANQLAIYKHSRGCELRTTVNKSN